MCPLVAAHPRCNNRANARRMRRGGPLPDAVFGIAGSTAAPTASPPHRAIRRSALRGLLPRRGLRGTSGSRRGHARSAIICVVRETNDRAFKEWAAVVRGLEAGATILLIRKGGIVEEGGALRVDDPEFFLFQNHTHQTGSVLRPRAREYLRASESVRPEEGLVRISSYAIVSEVFTVPNEPALARLDGEHLWTREAVLDRLLFKPALPLYAIALRVYVLPEPQEIVYLAAYGGCTSWVTLDEPLSTAGAAPALDDAAFTARLRRVHHALTTIGDARL